MTRPNVNWAQGWPGEDTAADLGEGGIRVLAGRDILHFRHTCNPWLGQIHRGAYQRIKCPLKLTKIGIYVYLAGKLGILLYCRQIDKVMQKTGSESEMSLKVNVRFQRLIVVHLKSY